MVFGKGMIIFVSAGEAPSCGFGSFHQQYWIDGITPFPASNLQPYHVISLARDRVFLLIEILDIETHVGQYTVCSNLNQHPLANRSCLH